MKIPEETVMNKETIRLYWEDKLPQTQPYYSTQQAGTVDWFLEVAYKRYNVVYPYLYKVGEFNKHGNEKVLEVGVGVGTDLIQYASNGSKVYGIDLTKKAIETSKNQFKTLSKNLELLEQGDVEYLQFNSNTFDLVYSFGVLHHTPDTQRGIDEIYRVLKRNGKVIIMMYGNGLSHYMIRILWHGIIKGDLLRMSYQDCINKNSETHKNTPITKVYRKYTLKTMFNKFRNVTIERYGAYWFLERHFPYPIAHLARRLRLEKWIGEQMIIKGYK